MENETTIQLAKQDETEYRSVRLNIGSDGTIRMDTHDMGPTVERVWNHEDYEFPWKCLHPQLGGLRSNCCETSFSEILVA